MDNLEIGVPLQRKKVTKDLFNGKSGIKIITPVEKGGARRILISKNLITELGLEKGSIVTIASNKATGDIYIVLVTPEMNVPEEAQYKIYYNAEFGFFFKNLKVHKYLASKLPSDVVLLNAPVGELMGTKGFKIIGAEDSVISTDFTSQELTEERMEDFSDDDDFELTKSEEEVLDDASDVDDDF